VLVGLPGGEVLVDAAIAMAPARPVVIAACDGNAVDVVRRAGAAGADLAVSRPLEVEKLAPVLLAAARLCDERRAATSAKGSETILRARLDALVEPEPGALQPFELFQRVLELELKRSRRYGYPLAVALFAIEIGPPEPPPGVRGILRARAGNALIHSIRDIDLATEVDQERFLVLLPYTTLTGAAEVARRIIGAVAGGDPVMAAGRVFPPKLVGAVAGASIASAGGVGQPLSFSRLMRDATQALEQARRDGAELAVPLTRGPE
jgi:PleD family two-component response regulator